MFHGMSTVTTTTLIDDLDPNAEADETVFFGLDGREYEIDLSDEHADDLRAALEPYVQAGRRANGKPTKPAKPEPGGKNKLSKEEATAIREWVRTNGGHIGERGRIPKDVLAAYSCDPKDTSIFQKKDDDEQPEPAEPVGVGAGGNPFAAF